MAVVEGKVKILQPGDHRDVYRVPETEAVKISSPLLDFMTNLENADVIEDYLTRHPYADKNILQDLLQCTPMFLKAAGLDFIFAKNAKTGVKEFLTLETNSCPGGYLSMPSYTRPYETHLLSSFFGEEAKWRMKKSEGGLAYLHGGTKLDRFSIPHFMAEISQEKVYMVLWPSGQNGDDGQVEDYVQFKDGVMYVKDDKDWVPIRACFRSFSNDWIRIPVKTMKTFIYPHPIACVGKNKHLAGLAYNRFNEEYKKYGLEIRTPKAVIGIEKKNLREIVGKEFGFRAVIKTPYSSQARGIYVIRNESDVDTFLETDESKYNLFIVQDLIGLETDRSENDEFIHVGNEVDGYNYAYTFRVTVCQGQNRFKILLLRGLNAPTPFSCNNNNNVNEIPYVDSMYITNVAKCPGHNRFIPLDTDGMKRMGITVGDIVDAYVQSVMSMITIDNICKELMREDGSLDLELLRKINPDEQLIREIEVGLRSELLDV